MSSSYPLSIFIIIYLLLIYKVLPKIMEHRKPFNLKFILRFYNIVQVVFCTYFVVKHNQLGISLFSGCQCLQPKDSEIMSEGLLEVLNIHYIFIFWRLVEFFETIFFILRKKFNQVSPLHVYHHVAVAILLWIHLKFNGGPMDSYIGVLNSFIHIIMYTYYFLSSFDHLTKFVKVLKPFITVIQITQLSVLLIHCCIALLPSCNASKVFILQSMNLILLIFMFVKFYIKSFNKDKKF